MMMTIDRCWVQLPFGVSYEPQDQGAMRGLLTQDRALVLWVIGFMLPQYHGAYEY